MGSEEVFEFLKGKVAKYKIPKYVAFIDELPKTGSGKIQKFLLEERHENEL
jgi:fatty-acyl-CoA synthase